MSNELKQLNKTKNNKLNSLINKPLIPVKQKLPSIGIKENNLNCNLENKDQEIKEIENNSYDIVFVGGGPSTLAFLSYIYQNDLQKLLFTGSKILIIEKSQVFGSGCLGKYGNRTNTSAEGFLKLLFKQPLNSNNNQNNIQNKEQKSVLGIKRRKVSHDNFEVSKENDPNSIHQNTNKNNNYSSVNNIQGFYNDAIKINLDVKSKQTNKSKQPKKRSFDSPSNPLINNIARKIESLDNNLKNFSLKEDNECLNKKQAKNDGFKNKNENNTNKESNFTIINKPDLLRDESAHDSKTNSESCSLHTPSNHSLIPSNSLISNSNNIITCNNSTTNCSNTPQSSKPESVLNNISTASILSSINEDYTIPQDKRNTNNFEIIQEEDENRDLNFECLDSDLKRNDVIPELLPVYDNPVSQQLRKIGNSPAALVLVGEFLNLLGAHLIKLAKDNYNKNILLFNSEVVGIKRVSGSEIRIKVFTGTNDSSSNKNKFPLNLDQQDSNKKDNNNNAFSSSSNNNNTAFKIITAKRVILSTGGTPKISKDLEYSIWKSLTSNIENYQNKKLSSGNIKTNNCESIEQSNNCFQNAFGKNAPSESDNSYSINNNPFFKFLHADYFLSEHGFSSTLDFIYNSLIDNLNKTFNKESKGMNFDVNIHNITLNNIKKLKVSIIGGSHSAFSSAWILLNGPAICGLNDPEHQKECLSWNKTINHPIYQLIEKLIIEQENKKVGLACDDPKSAQSNNNTANCIRNNSKSNPSTTFKPSNNSKEKFDLSKILDIFIIHKSIIKVSYLSVEDAEKDNYTTYDQKCLNTKGRIYPFVGIRADAKELFRSIKKEIESRVSLFKYSSEKQLLSKLIGSDVIVNAIGYETKEVKITNTKNSEIEFKSGEKGDEPYNVNKVMSLILKKEGTSFDNVFGIGQGYSLNAPEIINNRRLRADSIHLYNTTVSKRLYKGLEGMLKVNYNLVCSNKKSTLVGLNSQIQQNSNEQIVESKNQVELNAISEKTIPEIEKAKQKSSNEVCNNQTKAAEDIKVKLHEKKYNNESKNKGVMSSESGSKKRNNLENNLKIKHFNEKKAEILTKEKIQNAEAKSNSNNNNNNNNDNNNNKNINNYGGNENTKVNYKIKVTKNQKNTGNNDDFKNTLNDAHHIKVQKNPNNKNFNKDFDRDIKKAELESLKISLNNIKKIDDAALQNNQSNPKLNNKFSKITSNSHKNSKQNRGKINNVIIKLEGNKQADNNNYSIAPSKVENNPVLRKAEKDELHSSTKAFKETKQESIIESDLKEDPKINSKVNFDASEENNKSSAFQKSITISSNLNKNSKRDFSLNESLNFQKTLNNNNYNALLQKENTKTKQMNKQITNNERNNRDRRENAGKIITDKLNKEAKNKAYQEEAVKIINSKLTEENNGFKPNKTKDPSKTLVNNLLSPCSKVNPGKPVDKTDKNPSNLLYTLKPSKEAKRNVSIKTNDDQTKKSKKPEFFEQVNDNDAKTLKTFSLKKNYSETLRYSKLTNEAKDSKTIKLPTIAKRAINPLAIINLD